MAEIGGKRALYSALREMRVEMHDLFGDVADRIAGVVLRYAGPDGTIPPARGVDVRVEVASLIDDVFTGTIPGRRGRHAYGADGVSPLAPYPRILNKYIVQVVRGVVEPHARFMRRVVPADLQARLAVLVEVREQALDTPVTMAEQAGKGLLRLFHPNPLAWYEAAHTWVDPRGYRLSDRIWRTDQETRRKLDRLLAEMISKGYGAADIARAVEQYLIPARRLKTTTKPYGPRYGTFAFDAMRLARSEIARAHGQAAKAAAITNPYVEAVNWNLSLMHPKVDICDTIQAQNPHAVESAPVPVASSHPF